MRFIVPGVIVLAACLSCTAPAWAQDARATFNAKVRPGDKLTLTTRDGREVEGRFLSGTTDTIVLKRDGGEARVQWSDVDRVKRRRNGVLLGAIIGAGAGIAAGIPLGMLANNETGKGAQELTSMVLFGLGVGIGLDALISTERTLYDRSSQARLEFVPRRAGGSMRVTLTW